MGWTIFSCIVGGLIYNWVFILFGIFACVMASKQKSYSGLLIIGFLLNAISYYGYFAGLKRNPTLYSQMLGITIGYFLVLLVVLGLFIFACVKSDKSAKAKKEEQEAKTATVTEEETISAEEKYICTGCGKTSPSWYQTCPNCGAVGRMKKNT